MGMRVAENRNRRKPAASHQLPWRSHKRIFLKKTVGSIVLLIEADRLIVLPAVSESPTEEIRERLDSLYRAESGRILATLIRWLGDFDLAEDALHDALAAALVQWQKDGIPDNPRAWLVSTGRFKAIDALRRRARFDASQEKIAEEFETQSNEAAELDDEKVEDDRLRLIFTCCHPALAPEARVALTLREVCGLSTEVGEEAQMENEAPAPELPPLA